MVTNPDHSTGGYNPLRWHCKERGLCWNLEHRPNIEYFAHKLPRNISMMDLDATVEVNGHFLFMEFKSPGAPLLTGQRIYFKRLTELTPRISVCIVDGVCRNMSINKVMKIYRGRIGEWESCDLDGLCELVGTWASNVDMKIVDSGAVA